MLGAALIGTAIYTLLETFVKLIEAGCTYIAQEILDESITVFSANQNIFDTFISLVPFADTLNLSAIVKGVSYGVVILLMLISIIKSFTSPFTGDDSINPAQAAIRATLSIVLISVIFGASFGFTGNKTIEFSGLLVPVGKWFGTILSKIGNIPTIEIHFSHHWNVMHMFAAIILDLSVITSVVGAALQYVERIISFAVYIIFGPIACAMYTSKTTESITRTWISGIISEFLAIVVSLVMWIAFIKSANSSASGTLLQYAVMIALLGIMRNSEKIINAMGFKTISLGDTARSVAGGWMLTMQAIRTTSRFVSDGVHKNVAGSSNSSTNINNTMPLFDANEGNVVNRGSVNMSQFKSVMSSSNPVSAFSAMRSANVQNRSIASVQNALQNNTGVDSKTFNNAMGLSSNTKVHAVGSGEGGMLQPASVKTSDGNTVKGFVGDAVITKGNGQVEMTKDAFFAVSPEAHSLNSYSPIEFAPNYDGNPHYLSNTGYLYGNSDTYVYKTTIDNPNVSFDEAKKEIAEEIVHNPRNI